MEPTDAIGRFAPSPTGRAHPGTLLAGLLAWLDVRRRGGRFVLRLEDLDPERCTDEWRQGLLADLAWFGLDWDALEWQHDNAARHEAALDRLAAQGRLYPCSCSRARLKAAGLPAADGGWAYPGTCRGRPLPPGGWRAGLEPLRCRLDDAQVALRDESGLDLSQEVAAAMGDPVLRRRDGAVAYQLAVVVDDAAAGINRVVRGRDIAPSTATQVALHRLLGLPPPAYRHHLLLLEPHGTKLAKFHGSVSAAELREHYTPAALCGVLAWVAGLQPEPRPRTPRELVAEFAWERVRVADQVVAWDGRRLRHLGPG
ncbi:MAG: glutamate--tRNA ligase family protein [Lentisphaeria bacterium]|jgi:glutamyl/glutaminyl-tRNA synthetase